ncbi:MAG TPA: MBL fold metallo-hydrolase [Gemmatimonadaceae bacterium]|nr:MBL fold metallo-hydrolase [Gemmatimonadaceae bacterium]
MPSHHRPGGGFQNPWGPGSAQHGFGAFLRWVLIDRPRHRRPSIDRSAFAASHPRAEPRFPVPRAGGDDLVLTWVGHSSFLIQIGGRNLLVDPVWSAYASPIQGVGPRRWVEPGIDLAGLPPIDGVVISHDHYDHLDRPTVRRLVAAAPDAPWAAPLGVGRWLRRQGVRTVVERDWWESIEWGLVTLTATPAQHFSGRRFDNRNHTLWCGWVVRAGSRAVYYAGDTGFHPAFDEIGRRLGPFDAACVPIGAYEPEWFMRAVHMNPEEAVAAFQALGSPRAVVAGMHWGTFKLTDEPLDEPARRATAAWAAAGLPADRLWIPAHGETRIIT